MKFKLDENVPKILKHVLNEWEQTQVTTVREQNLQSTSDHALLKICNAEKRILVTLDADFTHPLLHPLSSLFGIIVLKIHPRSKSRVKALFVSFLRQYNIEDVVGKVVIVDANHIHIREEKFGNTE